MVPGSGCSPDDRTEEFAAPETQPCDRAEYGAGPCTIPPLHLPAFFTNEVTGVMQAMCRGSGRRHIQAADGASLWHRIVWGVCALHPRPPDAPGTEGTFTVGRPE